MTTTLLVCAAIAALGGGAGEFFVARWPERIATSPPRAALMAAIAASATVAVVHIDIQRGESQWVMAARVVLCVATTILAVVDARTHRLPDIVSLPATAVSLGLLVLAHGPIAHALIGAAVFFVFLGVVHVVRPDGMGFGDVKLALLLGLQLGWVDIRLVLFGLITGSLIGTLVGLVLLARKGASKQFAFGPALCAGAVITLAFIGPIIVRY